MGGYEYNNESMIIHLLIDIFLKTEGTFGVIVRCLWRVILVFARGFFYLPSLP